MSDLHEERRPNCASNTYQLDMSRLQAASCVIFI